MRSLIQFENEAEMPNLSLTDKQRLVEGVAEIELTQRLDDLWTHEAEQPGRIADSELETLVQRLCESIERAAVHATNIREIVLQNPTETSAAFEAVKGKLEVDGPAYRWWATNLEEAGGIISLTDKAMSRFAQDSSIVIAEIRSEFEALRAGSGGVGDMPARYKCGLMVGIAIAGGIGATVLTGGAAAFGFLTAISFASAGGAYCGAMNIRWRDF
jgi:hypothetical protein